MVGIIYKGYSVLPIPNFYYDFYALPSSPKSEYMISIAEIKTYLE